MAITTVLVIENMVLYIISKHIINLIFIDPHHLTIDFENESNSNKK